MYFMDKTLTLRLDAKQRNALLEIARHQGKSVSQLVRDLLSNALAERPLGDKAKHLKGQLKLSRAMEDAWRRKLKERNWRS